MSSGLGIVYLIHFHCGAFPQGDGFPDLGSTGNRVLWLVQNVPRDENYQLYMDNYSNSIPLMIELRKKGIHSMGTIRIQNASGFSKLCMPDKELSQLASRSFVEYIVTFEGSVDPGIRIIRWDDNSISNLAHTFGSGSPPVKAERWYCDNTKTSLKS